MFSLRVRRNEEFLADVAGANSILLLGDFPSDVHASDKLSISVHSQTGGVEIGTIDITVADLYGHGCSGGLFSSHCGSARVWMSCFCPDIGAGATSKQFVNSFQTFAPPSESSNSKLLIHVMDGLGCPVRNKSNLVVRFDVLESSMESKSPQCPLTSASTSGSTHLRQLAWDQKIVLGLPFRISAAEEAPLPGAVLGVSLLHARQVEDGDQATDSLSIASMEGSGMDVIARTESGLADLLLLVTPNKTTGRQSDQAQLVMSLQVSPKYISAETSTYSVAQSSVRIRLGLAICDNAEAAEVLVTPGSCEGIVSDMAYLTRKR